ncbi:MAG: DUF417 family protein [Parcubacteria group bacterium]
MISKLYFPDQYEGILVGSLRLTLAIIFIWFGMLKILGYNPVFDLIYYSMVPWFAFGSGLITLGVVETLIGLLLLTNRFILFTHIVLLVHLLGTFSTFIFGWHVVFNPHFPIFSLDGEFVIKNIVLVLSGLVVLAYEANRKHKKI